MCVYTSVSVTEDNFISGLRLQRGRDRLWRDEDYQDGNPGLGTITEQGSRDAWASVGWDNTQENLCRVGYDGGYDLFLANEAGR